MPQNWKTYKLSELGTIARGKSKHRPRDASHLYGGDYPFIQTGDVKAANHRLNSHSQTYSEAGLLQSKLWPKNTMCITIAANIAETAILEYAACFPDSIIGFVADEKLSDIDFVEYLMQYFKKQIQSHSIGSVQDNINLATFERVEFLVPPLPEQRAIAQILSSLDDKIELNLQMNKTLEEMAMTLYKHWFVDEANNVIEQLPLGDVLDFVVDNRGKTAPTASDGIPLIATNCVKNDRIYPTYEKVRYIDQETYENWFRSHPIPGDILFVNKGAPGSVNLVPDPIDFCIAQDMIALRVNRKLVSNFYLFAYFRLPSVQNEILNMSVGTTIPHLKKTDLLRFQIPIPNLDYLENYTDKVSPIFERLNLNRIENQTLTALRDTLLPKLISGEVRVTDAEQTLSKVL